MTNIYLRNISLGMSQGTTIFWTDADVVTHKFTQVDRMLSYRIKMQKEKIGQDYQMIQKTNSLFAKAYLESPFFYLSLKMNKKFIFIQNTERANENFLKIEDNDNWLDDVPVDQAGIELLYFLLQ